MTRLQRHLDLITIAALLGLLLTAGTAGADIYQKKEKHTDGYQVMGQQVPAKDVVSVTWMGKDRARVDEGEDVSSIIRNDQKRMYLLDHTSMSYQVMPIQDIGATMEDMVREKTGGDENAMRSAAAMRQFSSALMQVQATVRETGEKKKIDGFNCRKYLMTVTMPMGTTTSEIWATEDVKVDMGVYEELSTMLMASQPGFQDALKEMKKVKGIIVLQTSASEAMGSQVKTTEKLVEISQKAPPAGIYDIPSGYVEAR